MLNRIWSPIKREKKISDKEAYETLMKFNWTNLSSEERSEVTNGCGPMDFPFLAKVIPELVFNRACMIHDLNYLSGGQKKHRKWADSMFYDSMCEAVRKQTYWKRGWYYFWAKVYVTGVRWKGKKSFEFRKHPLLAWEIRDLIREGKV